MGDRPLRKHYNGFVEFMKNKLGKKESQPEPHTPETDTELIENITDLIRDRIQKGKL